MNNIGENIKRLRLLQNMTQLDLADKINVTSQAVSKWERGIGLPDTSMLPTLCSALHTSIDTLMSYIPSIINTTTFEEVYAMNKDSRNLKPSVLACQVVEHFYADEYPNIIDIGCGVGKDSVFFARNGYSVTAFDLARSGIDKVHKFADYCHVPVKAFVADMLSWRPEDNYNIVYAEKTLHYIKPEDRKSFIDKYKEHTVPGGVHVIEVYVKKPFIERAPDHENSVSMWSSGELFTYYSDWEILHIDEKVFDCCSSGIPHRHCSNVIIAKAPPYLGTTSNIKEAFAEQKPW